MAANHCSVSAAGTGRRTLGVRGWLACTAMAAMSALAADGATPSPITVWLPYGACRLVISEDGSGRFQYGAAPATVWLTPGTFRRAEVWRALRERADASMDLPTAPAALDDAGEGGTSTALNDATYVRQLFDHGWKRRMPPSSMNGLDSEGAHQFIQRACRF